MLRSGRPVNCKSRAKVRMSLFNIVFLKNKRVGVPERVRYAPDIGGQTRQSGASSHKHSAMVPIGYFNLCIANPEQRTEA